MLRTLVLAVVGLERHLAWLLLRRGRTVHVHPFPGFGTDGWVQVGGRAVVGAPPRSQPPGASVAGRWTVLRANLLPFLTVEVPRAKVRVAIGGRDVLVRADTDGYLFAQLHGVDLAAGRHVATLSPVDPPGEPSSATVHVADPTTELAVVSDIDDTIVDSGIAHGLVATVTTVLLKDQSTRVPLAGAPELYRALAVSPSGSTARAFVYLSTSPWNLARFLQGFLARHRFPEGPLVLTDWGPRADGALRASSRAHKLEALRGMAQALPRTRFVLIGDTGQQDPEIYADFSAQHRGRVAAVYVRRAGSAGPVADRRAGRAAALLADLGVPFLVTGDSGAMLEHAREHGLVADLEHSTGA